MIALEKHGLDYRKNLVGQVYDGGAVMSGKHSGVSTRIKNSARFAFNLHCNAHCLNLVLVDAVNSVPEAVNFLALLQKLNNFVSGLNSSGLKFRKSCIHSNSPGNYRDLKM